MLPTSGSQRPATPVVSRDFGLSEAQSKIGLLIPYFLKSRVASPIIGCVTANILRPAFLSLQEHPVKKHSTSRKAERNNMENIDFTLLRKRREKILALRKETEQP